MSGTVIFSVTAGLMLVAERLRPFIVPGRVGPPRARAMRIVSNLALAALNGAARAALLLPLLAWASHQSPFLRPRWMWGTAGLAIDLLVLDLWIYGWHRIVHAWPFAWRFHRVHHCDSLVDVTTSLRFHVGDFVLSGLSRAVVVYALAIPPENAFTFEVLTAAASMFHHGNVRLPDGVNRVVGWFIVTPAFHRQHHTPMRAVHDSNYATLLPVWDRLFRTSSGSVQGNATEPELPGLPGLTGLQLVDLLTLPARPLEQQSPLNADR